MKAVGVKILKAKLSEYLRLVKTGEVVLITERDEVIAELRPSKRQPVTSQSFEQTLEALAEKGEVSLRSEELSSIKKSVQRHDLGISSHDLLNILRDE